MRHGWEIVAAGMLIAATAFVAFPLAARPTSRPQVTGQRGRGAGPAPAPRTGTGLILGRVVEGTSARGVPGAVVDLTGAGAQPQRVQTDSDGRFLFRDLPSGSFALNVAKAGYLYGTSGQRVPRGPTRPIDLAEGERIGDVTVRLWKYGVLSGTVSGDAGEPVAGVQVGLLERTAIDGRPQLSGSLYQTMTDDRGSYRFSTVPPGDYLVYCRSESESGRALASVLAADMSAMASLMMRAMGGGGQIEDMIGVDPTLKAYAPVFYPGGLVPSQAAIVSVKSGEERSGLDMRSRLAPLVRISGVVTDQGNPVAQMLLRLVIADDPGYDMVIGTASSGIDGRFAFLAIPAGRYVLRGTFASRLPSDARGFVPRPGATPVPPGVTLSVTTPVVVSADDPIVAATGASTPLAIEATRGVPWRGRIVFEGTAPAPAPEMIGAVTLTVVNADSGPAELGVALGGRASADGTLTTVGVPAGRYRLRVSAPPPWIPRSAIAGGKDLLDVPFDTNGQEPPDVLLTFVDRPPAIISGTVRNARGTPDDEAIVFIFPADPRFRTDFSEQSRRMRAARTTKTGGYSVPGFPPGEYLVAAGSDELVNGWRQPAVLDQLAASAIRVEITNEAGRTVDLRRGAGR